MDISTLRNNIIFFVKIIVSIFIAIEFYSCNSDSGIYDGQTVVELPESNKQFEFFFDDSVYETVYIPIQVIKGSDTPKEIKVDFKIDYSFIKDAFLLTNESYTIKQDNIIDSIPIIINTKKLAQNYVYTVGITLSETSSVGIAKNYSTTQINLVRYSFIYKFTGGYVCYEPINQVTYSVNFFQLSDSVVVNDNFWDFTNSLMRLPYNFDINSNKVFITENTEWIDKSGVEYLVSGEGEYMSNGDFYTSYTLVRKSDNLEVESGIHYFTKQ